MSKLFMHPFTSPTLVSLVAALLMCVGNVNAGPPAPAGHPAAALLAARGYATLPMKKGGSGVQLTYQLSGTPEIGKPLIVKIMMLSAADARVVAHADEGLQLQGSGLAMQSTAGVAAEHQLTVVPKATGRFYVHVMSTANGRNSASAIAVLVGTDKDMPQTKRSGIVKTMPNGERVISMPAD